MPGRLHQEGRLVLEAAQVDHEPVDALAAELEPDQDAD